MAQITSGREIVEQPGAEMQLNVDHSLILVNPDLLPPEETKPLLVV